MHVMPAGPSIRRNFFIEFRCSILLPVRKACDFLCYLCKHARTVLLEANEGNRLNLVRFGELSRILIYLIYSESLLSSMDLLGGYGSGSDGGHSSGADDTATVVASAQPVSSVTQAQIGHPHTSHAVSAALPLPKLDADQGLRSSLPLAQSAPRRGAAAAKGGLGAGFGAGFGALPELGGTKSMAAGKAGLGLSGRRKVVQLQTMKPLTAGSDEVCIRSSLQRKNGLDHAYAPARMLMRFITALESLVFMARVMATGASERFSTAVYIYKRATRARCLSCNCKICAGPSAAMHKQALPMIMTMITSITMAILQHTAYRVCIYCNVANAVDISRAEATDTSMVDAADISVADAVDLRIADAPYIFTV